MTKRNFILEAVFRMNIGGDVVSGDRVPVAFKQLRQLEEKGLVFDRDPFDPPEEEYVDDGTGWV